MEYGTAGTYLRRVERTFNGKANSVEVEMPVMPLADGYSEYFILRDRKTGAPLKDFPHGLSYGGRTFHDKNRRRWKNATWLEHPE